MPYKHPNGTTPMTMLEFISAEAEREGTTPEKVMGDINQMLEDAADETEKHIRENLLALLKEAIERDNEYSDEEDKMPLPFHLVNTLLVRATSKFSGSAQIVVAVADFHPPGPRKNWSDKNRKVVFWAISHDNGSFYQPPDTDETIELYDRLDQLREEKVKYVAQFGGITPSWIREIWPEVPSYFEKPKNKE